MGLKIDHIAEPQAQSESFLKTLLTKDFQIGGNGFGDAKKASLFSELHILLSSGITLAKSLDILSTQFKNKKDQVFVSGLLDHITKGDSLSDALKKTGKFNDYEYYSIKIGEESGRMVEVLNELALYYENKIKQRRKIVGAMSYPLVVLGTALLAVIFMLNTIVPMFTDVFAQFNAELPGLTKMVIALSEWMAKYSWWLLGVIAAIVAGLYAVRKNTMYRKISSKVVLNIPVVGALIQKIQLARFCQSLSLLLQADVPIDRAFDLVKRMVQFYPLEMAISKIQKDIMRGGSLHQSMEGISFFDKRMVVLTSVAEEVNKLDEIYTNLNKQYTDEIEHQIGVMNNLLEPLLLIFVGGFIAVILISMYLPMFQLSTSIF